MFSSKIRHGVQHRCLFEQLLSTTHFGYEQVNAADKQARVNEVFDNVAGKYDLMNDLMSAGIHRLWKNHFATSVMTGVQGPVSVLDMASGTGDIGSRLKNQHPDCRVTMCDINKNMLEYARLNRTDDVAQCDAVVADAHNLPFASDRFDMVTIAFGIRNCTDISRVLTESYRVLKPGGKFACLEFGKMLAPWPLSQVYDFYSMQVIPVMGELVADDFKAYRYLVESIRQFPEQTEFARMISDQGFSEVKFQNLTLGVAAIHSGFKFK